MGFDLPTLPARPSSSTPTRTPTRTLNGPLIPRATLHYPPVHPARTLYGACPSVAGSVLVGRMIWFSLVLRIAPALVRISIWELVGPHNSRPVKVIGVDVVTDTDIWVETKAETFIEFTWPQISTKSNFHLLLYRYITCQISNHVKFPPQHKKKTRDFSLVLPFTLR